MICINERLSMLISTLHTDSENNHQPMEEVGRRTEPMKEMMDKELIAGMKNLHDDNRDKGPLG